MWGYCGGWGHKIKVFLYFRRKNSIKETLFVKQENSVWPYMYFFYVHIFWRPLGLKHVFCILAINLETACFPSPTLSVNQTRKREGGNWKKFTEIFGPQYLFGLKNYFFIIFSYREGRWGQPDIISVTVYLLKPSFKG